MTLRTATQSRNELASLARTIHLIYTNLKAVSGPDQLITPELLGKTQAAILAFLAQTLSQQNGLQFRFFRSVVLPGGD